MVEWRRLLRSAIPSCPPASRQHYSNGGQGDSGMAAASHSAIPSCPRASRQHYSHGRQRDSFGNLSTLVKAQPEHAKALTPSCRAGSSSPSDEVSIGWQPGDCCEGARFRAHANVPPPPRCPPAFGFFLFLPCRSGRCDVQGHSEAARELSEEAGIQDYVAIELFER